MDRQPRWQGQPSDPSHWHTGQASVSIDAMAWFAKKDGGPTAEELAAQQEAERREAAEAELRRKITLALEKDPAHRVMTVDGTHWICPYSFTLVPAAFGHVDPAREFLVEKRPFANGVKAKPVEEMRRQRWRLFLRQNGEFEPRLRITGADGRWLNPFNAAWTKLPLRPGQPAAEVIEAIAGALAACVEANDGRPMLELPALREAEERAARAESEAPVEVQAVGATKRVSGRATGEITAGAGADMDRAKGILNKMLTEMPDMPGFGMAVHYEPQDEIGGDFFASLPLGPDRFLLAVADVAGHGVQGALVVVAALKALRFIVKESQDLTQIICRLNESVKADLLQGQFITCWMGILEPSTRRLEQVCAGHTPIAIANPRAEPLARRVGGKAPALGMLPPTVFNRAVKTSVIELQPGDMVMQCTDGLTEASNPHREEFGDLRAIGSLVGVCEQSFEDAVDRIATDARRWAAGTFQDDVTVLVLQCDPPQPGEAKEA